MVWLYILLGAAALTLLTAGVCYYMAFYSPPRTEKMGDEELLPPGSIYEPYYPVMRQWIRQLKEMECEVLTARSEDGLTLWGRYYEYAPGAPIELMFHGYRGMADRDLCGGVQRCFALGHSALIVDQRAAGHSDGRTITFGVKESRDVHAWLQVMLRRFGADTRIILCGISMGATTVLMAAGDPLPQNVVGVLADCGYTRARDIIKKVIRQMKLPADLLYPLVRLGARLYGGFDPDRADATAALSRCGVPVIFFHGDDDDFVPCGMSRENYEACAASTKRLVITPGAGHGLCYPADPEGYLAAAKEFFSE